MGLEVHSGSGWTESDGTALQVDTNTAACSYVLKSTLSLQQQMCVSYLGPVIPVRLELRPVHRGLQSDASKQRKVKGYGGFRESENTFSASDLPEAREVFVLTVFSALPQALLCSVLHCS